MFGLNPMALIPFGRQDVLKQKTHFITYRPIKNNYQFSLDSPAIKGWAGCAARHSNIEHKSETIGNSTFFYLARADAAKSAFIEWTFSLNESMAKYLDKLELKIPTNCLGSGKVELSMRLECTEPVRG